MLLSIAADERAALQFDDLASALDAGLPIDSLMDGRRRSLGEDVITELVRSRGVKTTANEQALLNAAWKAGRIGAALRNRAQHRRERAAAARSAWQGLRYPFLLLLFLLFASLIVSSVAGSFSLFLTVLALIAAIAGVAVAILRGVRSGSSRWLAMPWLGRMLQDLGELPYLETLQSLYASGVPLIQAHGVAVDAVGVLGVKERLRITDRLLGQGRSLTESLQASLALNPETRTLLATGERAGQLEESLHKALVRRRDVVTRGIADAARRAGAVAYGCAICGAVFYIVWIYRTMIGPMYSAAH